MYSSLCLSKCWKVIYILERVLYGIGFCLCTLLIQIVLDKLRNKHNRGNTAIWVGNSAIVVICIMGLMTRNTNCFSSILGFIIADEIGKQMGWH